MPNFTLPPSNGTKVSGWDITLEEKEWLLHLHRKDITAELMEAMLADTSEVVNGKFKTIKSRFQPDDEFVLKPNECFNKTEVRTNVGLLIFNKLLIEENFSGIVGYINTPINKKNQSQLEAKLSKALLNDKITVEQFRRYLDDTQWLAMQFNSILSGSFTMKTLKPNQKAIKVRDKLLKDNDTAIKDGDVLTAVQIENEVKKIAREDLEGDPGMDLYDSGARGSFDNNYKSIALMKGPVFNPTTGRWDVVQSNFMEGIHKEEIPVYGNSVVTGAYPKAVGTQVSGYLSKQLTAAFQGIVLDKPGSDCHTKGYLDIVVTPWLKKDIMYSYMIEGDRLVVLDDDNFDKYVGKRVKLRNPMFCIGEKLCRACAGTMFDKLGIENIGLTTAKVSSTLLNLNMKKFHNSTASIHHIDLSTIGLKR